MTFQKQKCPCIHCGRMEDYHQKAFKGKRRGDAAVIDGYTTPFTACPGFIEKPCQRKAKTDTPYTGIENRMAALNFRSMKTFLDNLSPPFLPQPNTSFEGEEKRNRQFAI